MKNRWIRWKIPLSHSTRNSHTHLQMRLNAWLQKQKQDYSFGKHHPNTNKQTRWAVMRTCSRRFTEFVSTNCPPGLFFFWRTDSHISAAHSRTPIQTVLNRQMQMLLSAPCSCFFIRKHKSTSTQLLLLLTNLNGDRRRKTSQHHNVTTLSCLLIKDRRLRTRDHYLLIIHDKALAIKVLWHTLDHKLCWSHFYFCVWFCGS